MNIVCLDMEGVLVPEIWIAFSEHTGIPELRRTTRDEPDYDKLMKYRIAILKEHGLGLKEIQETIAKIEPLPGAREFLDQLRAKTQVIIISDTFSQFATPLMEKLGWPTIFCNSLEVAEDGTITDFKVIFLTFYITCFNITIIIISIQEITHLLNIFISCSLIHSFPTRFSFPHDLFKS